MAEEDSGNASAVKPTELPGPDLSSLVVVSRDPLVVIVPSFLSPASCDALTKMCMPTEDCTSDDVPAFLSADDEELSDAERKLITAIEEALGEVSGQPPHVEETPLLPMLTRPTDADSTKPFLPQGLHVDTNGGCPRRFAGIVVYLSTPVGGTTVFPLATAGPDLEQFPASFPLLRGRAAGPDEIDAGRQMIDSGVLHTRHAKLPADKDAAERLLATAEAGVGLAAVAKRGSLAMFWCRDGAGVCARSWHSGAKVGPGGEPKLILRKFKNMPEAVFAGTPEEMSSYVSATRQPHMACSE